MRTKGYISIFALLVGLLLFTVLSFILLSIDSHQKIDQSQLVSYQEDLLGESLTNAILTDVDKLTYFSQVMKNDEVGDKGSVQGSYGEIYDKRFQINHEKISEEELRIYFSLKDSLTSYNTHISYELIKEEVDKEALEPVEPVEGEEVEVVETPAEETVVKEKFYFLYSYVL